MVGEVSSFLAAVTAVNFTFIKKIVNYHIDRAGKYQMTKPPLHIFVCIILIGIFLSFILAGCSKSGSSEEGELFIKLLDAPGPFQQMNIVVDHVSVHRADVSGDVGWTVVTSVPTVSFDLLNLRNGRNLQLVLSKVPIGAYNQIKIYYGACTIVNASGQQLLNLDPAIQAGDILDYGFQIVQGQQAQITFDFDAYQSVYLSGESYFFKPEIRIQNTVLSLPVTSTVHTYTGVDSVTTLCDPNGSFQISDLPENTYAVTIVSGDPKLNDTTISNITVLRMQGYNIGAIKLSKK